MIKKSGCLVLFHKRDCRRKFHGKWSTFREFLTDDASSQVFHLGDHLESSSSPSSPSINIHNYNLYLSNSLIHFPSGIIFIAMFPTPPSFGLDPLVSCLCTCPLINATDDLIFAFYGTRSAGWLHSSWFLSLVYKLNWPERKRGPSHRHEGEAEGNRRLTLKKCTFV